MAGPANVAPDAKAGPGRGGFTLVEVLVALTILALALAPLLRVYASGMRLGAAGERYAAAVIVAESVLAEATTTPPYSENQRNGATEDGFDWSLRVEKYQSDANLPAIFSFRSDVRWGDGQKVRTVSLATLRVSPGTEDKK